MRDDELTQEPEDTADDEPRPGQQQADVPDDAGTVDPRGTKAGRVEPKPHVRE
jgi:hypothetical protein